MPRTLPSRLTLFVVASLLLFPAVARAQGAMTNGLNHAGAISLPGEIDTWTFSATAGDAIILAIGEVGPDSAFVPWIRLYRPDSTLIGSQSGTLATQIEVAAPATGTYTVEVASNDSGNNDTGNYTLTLAKAPGAFTISGGDEGGALTNGANHTGSIHVGDLDMWSFSATAGDNIILRIGEVGVDSAFAPWIRLKSPTGQNLGSQSGVLATEIEATATVTGTYTVIVATNDSGWDATGDYTLTLAKAPGAFTISGGDEGGGLTNGANHTGSIHVGDVDMWSFSATAGDNIILRIGEVGVDSAFAPWIRLRSPTGQNLGSQSGVLATEIEATATVTGTYTVIVTTNDSGWDATGDYTLTLAKSPGSFTPGDEGGALTNGANHTGSIHVGDVDMWSFSATAGDNIILRIGEVGVNSAFAPWIRLKSPTGQNLGSQSGVLATEIEATATVTGTYTVIVTTNDSGWDATGDYTLTLAKSPGSFTPGDEGGALTNGANHTGSIHVGDVDMWSFSATAGDNIILRIGEVGPDGVFVPWIRLRSPTGQSLGSSSGVRATEIEATATVTGTYTVIVTTNDSGWDATGDYTLTLAKSPGSFTPGDEGGALTNGANHTGSIHVGDVDMWSFSATAGDSLILRIGEVGPDGVFAPWIRLRSPTGQNLGSISGVRATEIEATATVTGTYTVIVTTNDSGWDATGDYTLTLAKSPGAFTPGDEGGALTNGANHTGSIHVGDVDMWSFTATAGEALAVSIGEVGLDSAFAPWIRLKSPTGQSLGSISGVLATQINATATVTGTYTVIVTTNDSGWDATGDYTLTIANTPRPFVVSLGDQGGPMAAGPNPGTIHIGDLDMWTFAAHEGDPLVVTIAEVAFVSPDFTPWIQLRSPTGALLGSQSGAAGAQINATATVTGIYTVVVGTLDGGFDGFGDYVLSATGNSSSMICNGTFTSGETCWQFFATPTLGYIVHSVVNGVLEYYRVAPPPGTTNQAVAFQDTGVSVPAGTPLAVQFDLANTSTVRKRISVLVLDADFSDLSVCTFWLEPAAPMRTYRMRTHAIEDWTSAALYFYAASAGSNGGVYQIDNVSMAYAPTQAADRTDCVDPTVPAAPGGASGPNLLVNGDFNTGTLPPWFTFGTITTQITAGVLEFLKATSTAPAGVVAQPTGQAMAAGQILTATFQLGNSSIVRKRVTVLVHDSDFSDLSACTFWLAPGQPLSDYTYRSFATKAWTNAMVSVYPATVGAQQWILLDNVTFQRTPATAIVGTECLEPGAASTAFAEAARQAPPMPDVNAPAPATTPFVSAAAGKGEIVATTAGRHVMALGAAIDLRDAASARLSFESLLKAGASRALVQISLDGRTWVTLGEVPALEEWTSFGIDLSAFAGEVVWVRFVFDVGASFGPEAPAVWRIGNVWVEVKSALSRANQRR